MGHALEEGRSSLGGELLQAGQESCIKCRAMSTTSSSARSPAVCLYSANMKQSLACRSNFPLAACWLECHVAPSGGDDGYKFPYRVDCVPVSSSYWKDREGGDLSTFSVAIKTSESR